MINFLLGILFITLCYPAIELLVSYLQQWMENKCTKIAVETFKIKKEIEEQQEEYIQHPPAIGFKLPDDPQYYEDDEQEEQDD